MKIIDQIRFAQSDPEEMTKIIAQFLPLLKKYARKLFYSDALFDLQADFIELVQNFDVLEFHPDDNPHILSYINRSMKNAYIKYSKREQRYHSHQLPLGDLSDDERDLVEKRSFVLEDYCGLFLQDLSNLLSNREFYVIIQYIFHQKSINDISKELCISRQATSKIKKKAFEKLRSELD